MRARAKDGVSGDWRVETFEVSKEESAMSSRGRIDEYVLQGTYKRLMRGRTVVMSNTQMEIRTNKNFVRIATGRILINGLGLGIVLDGVLGHDHVTEVVVVEQSEDVINLVGSSFDAESNSGRVRIVHASAFDYQPSGRYDCVWHDIWDNICADNLEDMHKLHRKYGRRAEWQGSWCREQCEQQRRKWLMTIRTGDWR